MRIDILTLFPGMFRGPLEESILKRAQEAGLVDIHLHNIRDYATDKHRITDDYPYGGGAGMVMKPEPIFVAVEEVLAQLGKEPTDRSLPIVLLTPQGRPFTQEVAAELSRHLNLALICGHYEGVDERVREHLATDEISIGDYVLTGGELAAMVVLDAVVRLLPEVLGDEASAREDSFSGGLLEYPQYTRPASFRGWEIPEILLSGHHAQIARWRREQAILRTGQRRPDLLAKATLTTAEHNLVERLKIEKRIGR